MIPTPKNKPTLSSNQQPVHLVLHSQYSSMYPQMIPNQTMQRAPNDRPTQVVTKNTLPLQPPVANLKSVPAFLNKLYNMVSDASTGEMIKWAVDGLSFVGKYSILQLTSVDRHEEFSKEVLPRFFKHNNFSSFVRQLNMVRK